MSSVPFLPLQILGVEKKKRLRMLGSPSKKRNYKISPTKNKEARRYKGSRERDHKKSNKKMDTEKILPK